MDLGIRQLNALVMASSQGLGKAIAKKLVEEGANVMLAARNEEKLKEVHNELSSLQKGKVFYIKTDITSYEDIKNAVLYTVEQFGSIDLLLNNAGGPKAGSFDQITDEDWKHAFELNLLSYIRIIREVLPYMKENGGRILNIASSSVKEPISGLILSNTFRLGIVGLTKTLAQELASHNILINTIAPGRISTDRVAQLDQISAEKQGVSVEQVVEKIESQIPLGRYGNPEEFANYAVFLLSKLNTYVTGQTLLVDGGMVKSI